MYAGDEGERTLRAARADIAFAGTVFDDAGAWLDSAMERGVPPFAAETWVVDSDLARVLLVRHRIRGWVAPGGMVENGEEPREAAARELFEETGVEAALFVTPAAAVVRDYHPDIEPTLGLVYAALVSPDVPLRPEPGQAARWFSLDEEWESWFPEDRGRILSHVERLRRAPGRPK
ncbi:NUDIX domain-containing protein [Salininema proteolyticum]|uniref:NUDIX domain-containing protein n=1 Tax=Salininema proteolyticum TaxID=1607685 RepID=A0ABV8U5Z1_9ACTN